MDNFEDFANYSDDELREFLKDENMDYKKYSNIKEELNRRENEIFVDEDEENREVDNYIYNDIKNPKKSGYNFYQIIITLGLTIFLILNNSYSASFIIILSIAILIHELGHAIAMKVFGYKDVKIFIIPLLGGLTSGKNRSYLEIHSVLVSLAGPVVGLIFGVISLVLYSYFQIYYFYLFFIISLYLNAFNLLPLLPLDGGHVFEKLFPLNFYKTKLFIQIFSILGLIYLGYFFNSNLLYFLALLSLVGLKENYKQSKILGKIRDEFMELEFSLQFVTKVRERLNDFYNFKSGSNYISYKIIVIKNFVNLLLEKPMSLSVRVFVGVLYFILLLISVIVIRFYV